MRTRTQIFFHTEYHGPLVDTDKPVVVRDVGMSGRIIDWDGDRPIVRFDDAPELWCGPLDCLDYETTDPFRYSEFPWFTSWAITPAYPDAIQDEKPDGTRVVTIEHDGRSVDATRIHSISQLYRETTGLSSFSVDRVLPARRF